MDESLHNSELLIRFLDGELKGQEKMALEERLKTNNALQEELTRLRVALQAVKHLGTQQQVAGIHSEMMQELKPRQGKVVRFSRAVKYTMAAAAAVVILFVGVRLYTGMQLTSEKLYDESFVDFNASVSRGTNNDLSEVAKHYQQKDYTAVIGALRSMNFDAKDSLLLGLSYLHTNRTAQAISLLQQIANSPSEFQQDGEFYLSLGYLKNKQYDKALPLMEKIAANPAHLYHEQFSNDYIQNVRALEE